MPTFTTCLNFLPVRPRVSPRRTAPTKSASFWRESRTSAWIAAEPAKSERSAVCSTARRSVVLIGSPRNIAAMRASRFTARASSINSASVSAVTRWREIIEQPIAVLEMQILPALGVGGVEVAQMRAAQFTCLALDGLPGGK